MRAAASSLPSTRRGLAPLMIQRLFERGSVSIRQMPRSSSMSGHSNGRAPAFATDGFQNHVERRLRRAAEAGEAAAGDDLAEPRLAGLRAERRSGLLRERGRHANHRGGRVVQAADRVEVVLQPVAPSAPRSSRFRPASALAHMRRRTGRVAHVMQTIEEGDEVVAARKGLRRADLEADISGAPCCLACSAPPRWNPRGSRSRRTANSGRPSP